MRRIKTSTGVDVVLDGDLLAMMEVLYHEVTAKRELERSFEDMNREIANLIAQMTAVELRQYLQEALFVNTITFENQRAAAYIRRVGGGPRTTKSASPLRNPRTRG
jgi:phage gp29-like protein